MYVRPNFKTKKALKEAVKEGREVDCFSPGRLGDPVKDGTQFVEGPWFPAPHTWYGQVEVLDGKVVKVK